MENAGESGEKRYMREALRLAGRGVASLSPVGAVIVRDGCVVGRGYHRGTGEPHAEVVALREAGEAAREADLYVTLEPCSHFGRTPPCVDAVIAAGLRRVFVGCMDPNPRVAGRGVARLRAAGIEVYEGPCEAEAREFNEPHRKFILTGLPLVTLKLACSLDGKIATTSGESKWITGEEARRFAHRLRAQHKAILVGANTILADDPSLTVRMARGPQPRRIVVDSRGRVPATARVYAASDPSPIVATTESMNEEQRHILSARGVEVLILPDRQGRVSLEALLTALAKRQVTSLLVEGGGQMAAGFLEAGLVDKAWFIIAPVIIGGECARTAVEGRGVERLADAWHLQHVTVKRLGQDVAMGGYLPGSVVA